LAGYFPNLLNPQIKISQNKKNCCVVKMDGVEKEKTLELPEKQSPRSKTLSCDVGKV